MYNAKTDIQTYSPSETQSASVGEVQNGIREVVCSCLDSSRIFHVFPDNFLKPVGHIVGSLIDVMPNRFDKGIRFVCSLITHIYICKQVRFLPLGGLAWECSFLSRDETKSGSPTPIKIALTLQTIFVVSHRTQASSSGKSVSIQRRHPRLQKAHLCILPSSPTI